MDSKLLYQDFVEQQRILGYTKNICCKKLDEEDIKILNYLYLTYLKGKDKQLYLDNICFNELIDITKFCIGKYFSVHNVKKEKENVDFDTTMTDFFNLDKMSLNKAWNKKLQDIDPYSVPIEFEDGDSFEVSGLRVRLPEKYYYFCVPNFKIENLSIESIILGKNLNLSTVVTYAHELMHTQLEDRRIYTNDFQNIEIIPIFVELLIANYLDNKLINNFMARRLNDYLKYLSNINNFYDKIKRSGEDSTFSLFSCYANSIGKAIEIFDAYINANNDFDRRKIIYDIQDVIDGKITIEEMMGQHNIGKIKGKRLEIIKRWTR